VSSKEVVFIIMNMSVRDWASRATKLLAEQGGVAGAVVMSVMRTLLR